MFRLGPGLIEGETVRSLSHVAELPWRVPTLAWFDRGVRAAVKALALSLCDSLCCSVGFILRLTHSGLLFSHLHVTKPKMGTDKFLRQASWRTGHLSVPEISEKPLLLV